jgi:SAM-dependent methyltransferase
LISKLSFPAKLISFCLKIFFNLLYHQFAWSYDLVAWVVSLGMWQEWVAAALPHLGGNRILELGHGPGHLQVALLSSGKQAYALDESRQMNRIAARKVKGAGLEPKVVNGYAQILPFSSASYEHVVATFPSEYIFQPSTLFEIKRVLVPDGNMVIIPAAIFSGHGFLVRLLRLVYRITGQAPDEFNQATMDHFTLPLKHAGFDTATHLHPIKNSQVLVVIANPRQDVDGPRRNTTT